MEGEFASCDVRSILNCSTEENDYRNTYSTTPNTITEIMLRLRAVLKPWMNRILLVRRVAYRSSSSAVQLVGWDVQPAILENRLHKPEDVGRESNIQNHRFIGTLTLQSESTLNALTVDMGREFQRLVANIAHDITTGQQRVDAVVLVGAGDNAFSAGGDLSWLRSLRDNTVHANADLMLQFYKSFLCLRSIPVPIIAALHGPAMGAGAGLALACDFRTACPHPKLLGLHFSRLGIHAGMGSSHYLPQVLAAGSGMVNEILLLGRILSGEDCYRLGLVNRLAEDARSAALDLALALALDPHPVAVRTLVQTLRQQQDQGLEQALQREAMAQAICYSRADWGEGIAAMAAKRRPSFDPYHA
jgi:enoyl-CoA hydratase